MFRVLTCLAGEHDLRLVLLAGCICFLASWVAISLFRRASATKKGVRAGWLALAGVATGCGIWATHFIAMLAYEPGVAIAYDITLTVLSLFLAVAITGAGLSIAIGNPNGWSPKVGGAIVGGGVASMHYTGMWALELPGRVTWAPDLAVASIVLGILLGSAAMMVIVRHESKRQHLLGAVLLTLAIVSHHFTAMGAVEILPDPTKYVHSLSLSPASLALAVAGAAILILGLSLAGAFADRRMQERDAQLITAVNNMSHGVVMFDAFERLVVCNARYIEMYGLSTDVVIAGTTLRDLMSHRIATGTLKRDPDEYRTALLSAVAKGEVTSWIAITPEGRAIAVTNRPMPGGAWVGTHEDVTERRQAEERIEYLAHHDALTDLPNRLLFHQQLEQSLKELRRGERLALLYVGLDQFKSINDTLGHPVGDELLKAVAARLQGCLNETDTVARLGGDEFAIIQMAVDKPTDTTDLVQRIHEAIREPYEYGVHQFTADASIGIAMAPDDGADSNELLKNADLAMYGAKADGRGTYRFFEPDMDARVKARRALEFDLRQAIMCGEFELYYQPLVNLKDNKITGCEALLRWRHSERGTVSPAEFIPIAEETGLIVPLGEWVLRTACAQAATWPDDIKVAVNVSPVQFKSGNLVQMVINVLAASGLPAHRLELEITEAVLIRDDEATLAVLHQLRQLGVRIAMDDFGTGYSSLGYLQRFPFDKIKIDRSFIKDVAEKDGSLSIVQAVVSIAQSRNITTTAEGVETQQQMEALRTLGCTEMQGYLFSPAIPAAEILRLFPSYRAKAVKAA